MVELERARARFSGYRINEACTTRRSWKTSGRESSWEGAARRGDRGEYRRIVAVIGVSACVCLCVFVRVEARKLLTVTVGCLVSRESCV